MQKEIDNTLLALSDIFPDKIFDNTSFMSFQKLDSYLGGLDFD